MKFNGLVLAASVACLGMFGTGCAGVLKANNAGFPSATPGFIVTDMTAGQIVENRVLPAKYTVLGPVSAEATTVNYFGLVALGDASYKVLKRAALERYPAATDIINLEVDCRHKNVLCIINEVTTIIRGTAIKY